MTSLIVLQVPVSKAIFLLGVQENVKIMLIHSLLTVSPDVYSSNVQLWGVVGDLPEYGNPALLYSLGFTSLPTSLSEESPAPSLRHMSGASTSIPEGLTPTPSKLRSSPTRDRSRFYLVAYASFLRR